jgi:protein gp37
MNRGLASTGSQTRFGAEAMVIISAKKTAFIIERMKTMNKTGISWTDRTWNFIAGCAQESEGCAHCWAVRDAIRLAGNPNKKISSVYAGLTKEYSDGPHWTGEVRLLRDRLRQPLRTKKKERVFACAMADLFHPAVPDDFIDEAIAVMSLASRKTFQILTKRVRRMKIYFDDPMRWALIEGSAQHIYSELHPEEKDVDLWLAVNGMPENIELGMTAENQRAFDERIDDFLDIDARIHFVSLEPLLGPIKMTKYGARERLRVMDLTEETGEPEEMLTYIDKLDGVVAGCETGMYSSPGELDWLRDIRDQCLAAYTPFHFKSWGEWTPYLPAGVKTCREKTLNGVKYYKVGSRRSGRLLDGLEYLGFPRKKTTR